MMINRTSIATSKFLTFLTVGVVGLPRFRLLVESWLELTRKQVRTVGLLIRRPHLLVPTICISCRCHVSVAESKSIVPYVVEQYEALLT